MSKKAKSQRKRFTFLLLVIWSWFRNFQPQETNTIYSRSQSYVIQLKILTNSDHLKVIVFLPQMNQSGRPPIEDASYANNLRATGLPHQRGIKTKPWPWAMQKFKENSIKKTLPFIKMGSRVSVHRIQRQPMCVCLETISVMKEFNLSRHYKYYNCTEYNASCWT